MLANPIHVLTLALEEEWKLFPQPAPSPSPLLQGFLADVSKVWAEKKNPMGLARHQAPFLVQLKAGAKPVQIRQYPVPREARMGVSPHSNWLWETGILILCRLAWNTPLLLVETPHSCDHQPVQDLREVNKQVEDIHPSVNPSRAQCTLCSTRRMPSSSCLWHPSQPLFARIAERL